MKTRFKNTLAGVFIFMIAAAPSISFDAKFPARKPLPEHIKTIAVIDRSGRESKLSNIIEGGLTGEGIGQDREAVRRLIDGITNQLNGAGRFWAVKTSLEMVVDEPQGEFSKMLSWAHVKGICSQHNAQAVLSVEYFDTDHISDLLQANVGIRIYDPENKTIVDEHAFSHAINKAKRKDDLLNLVTSYLDQDAVLALSYEAGLVYGQRISPYWLRVERKYYKRAKGDDDFAAGARMMEVNDWDNAISAFEKALQNNSHKKVKGRSCHNLAVIHEILGNYEVSRDYARDAWTMYKNKDSRDYAAILSRRIMEIRELQEQG